MHSPGPARSRGKDDQVGMSRVYRGESERSTGGSARGEPLHPPYRALVCVVKRKQGILSILRNFNLSQRI